MPNGDRKDLTLNGWQEFFVEIYGERNKERFGVDPYVSLSGMWLRLWEDTSYLARGIRRDDLQIVLKWLPHVFCWYCGFATKLGLSIDELIWHDFPHVCPTCWKECCVCGSAKRDNAGLPAQKDEDALVSYGRVNAHRRPIRLDGYVQMFAEIYGGHSESSTLHDIFLHLDEENGEVARHVRELEATAMNRGDTTEALHLLKSEMADVFSWLCKISWRVDTNVRGFGKWLSSTQGTSESLLTVRFSQLVFHEYRHGCPHCRTMECRPDCSGWLASVALPRP